MLRKFVSALRSHNSIYSHEYYDRDVAAPARQAAPSMAASIIETFKPKTIIDIGCGTGALLKELRRLKCEVLGLEYSTAGISICKYAQLPVQKFNILKDHIPAGWYDVAVSLEVAEHLPERGADRFADLLCALSGNIVMSAATPGQGGTDHVNEQPHSYWIKKFEDRKFQFEKAISSAMAARWESHKVAGFYHRNLMIFTNSSGVI